MSELRLQPVLLGSQLTTDPRLHPRYDAELGRIQPYTVETHPPAAPSADDPQPKED